MPQPPPHPRGPLERAAHFLVAALVVGAPLAWLAWTLVPSWLAAGAILGTCGLLGALRGDAFLRAVAASHWWSVVRGWFLLGGR